MHEVENSRVNDECSNIEYNLLIGIRNSVRNIEQEVVQQNDELKKNNKILEMQY